MSGSRAVASLLLVALSLMLGTSTALGQQSQLREVPGARVTVRADSGWSYDLTLWRDYALDELGEYHFERFVLQGWATTPELDSFPIQISLSTQYLTSRHNDWTIDAAGATGIDTRNGELFRTDAWRGNFAKITLGDDRVSLAISISDAYRSAVSTLDGFEPVASEIVFWYSIASVFEGTASGNFVSYSGCVDTARQTCRQVCESGQSPRHCVKSVSYDAEHGSCSFTCMTFDECCGTTSTNSP